MILLTEEGCFLWGVLPPGGASSLPPGGCFLPSSRGVLPWGGGALLLGGPDGDPPGTATAAGGTHPTGMHSCQK